MMTTRPLARFLMGLTMALFAAGAGSDTAATATETANATTAAEEAPPDFTEAYLSDAANVTEGEELWAKQCRHCHGSKAYPGKAPKLKPAKYKPDFVFKRVTKGFRKMPAWKDVYTREQRMSIVAYVLSDKFSP